MAVKWLGHEADHLLQSSIEVGSEWSCTSFALYMPMVGTGTLLFLHAIAGATSILYKLYK